MSGHIFGDGPFQYCPTFFLPDVHHPRTRKGYIYAMRIFYITGQDQEDLCQNANKTKKTYVKMLTTLQKFIQTSINYQTHNTLSI